MALTTFSGPVQSLAGFITATGTAVAGGSPVPLVGSGAGPGPSGQGPLGPGIYFGSGAPTISAPQGSFYLNTTGSSTSTRAYINTNGTTGWTAVTTAT